MSAEETRGRVIGLITAAYTALEEGSADDFVEMATPLLTGLLSGDIHVEADGSEDVQSLIRRVSQETVDSLEPNITTVITTFLFAFVILAQEYEATSSEKSVLEIIQDIALSIDGPEDLM